MTGKIFNTKQVKYRRPDGAWARIKGRLLGKDIEHLCDEEGLRPRAAIRRLGIDALNKYAEPRIERLGERTLTKHGAVDITEQWAMKEGYDW